VSPMRKGRWTPPRRKIWFSMVVVGAALLTATANLALAISKDGFEMDAQSVTNVPADLPIPYYSGNDPSGAKDDWAQGATGKGVFTSSDNQNGSCYKSTITVNPNIGGAAGFICDGLSVSAYAALGESDNSIVSPSGKTPDGTWNIKPGNNTPKDDISHGYTLIRNYTSPCNSKGTNKDQIIMVGGERLNNEGDSFWGFEFDQKAPTNFDKLLANGGNGDGTAFKLIFNRTIGDILLSVSLDKGGTKPTIAVYQVTAIAANGTATFTQQTSSCATPVSEGFTNAATDAQAPGWNIPVCDPSVANPANKCRLVNGAGDAPAPLGTAGDKDVPPRDFLEAAIDLSEFGINPGCFNNVLFTSRSSSSVTADLKDVGGGQVPVCSATAATQIHAGSATDPNHSTTDIQNTTVVAGSTIHDKVIVTGVNSGGGTAVAPTGNVVFSRYTNKTCTGTPAATETKALVAGSGGVSSVESSNFVTPVAGGDLSYKAVYTAGQDTNYPAGAVAACEPLTAINPSTILDKKASISATITYAYQEKNDGTVALTMPAGGYVTDNNCSPVRIVGDTAPFNTHEAGETWSGDTNNDGILSAGETWDFSCQVTVNSAGTTTNTATGHGIDPVNLDVTFCSGNPPAPGAGQRCDQDERDSVTVTIAIDNGADRLFK
jgi:hypothetical protein